MSNRRVYLCALALVMLGTAGFAYKTAVLGFPLVPEDETTVWTVEATATFRAEEGEPVRARLQIPSQTPGFAVLDEDLISSNYGFQTSKEAGRRYAEWTVRRARGSQALYYRVTVVPDGTERRHTDPHPGYPTRTFGSDAEARAVEALLDRVRRESADIESFALALIRRLNNGERISGGVVEMLNDRSANPVHRARQIASLLAGARIPSRVVHGVRLRDGIRDAELAIYLEVHDDTNWIPIDPMTGERGYPDDFLSWTTNDDRLFELVGGSDPQVRFAVKRNVRAVVDIAAHRAESGHRIWFQSSLLSLPIQTQNVYRILLMIPIGAFVVVVLRTFVGIATFGTFMPVLIALAFRETDLSIGVALFVLILAIGLMLRFALERLHLLLVPRLTAVLVLVVLIMLMVSVVSFHVGVERGISVALFPMVILAMTIERMSMVWEELGSRAALTQGAGSLVVAILAYFVVTNQLLAHVVFLFPETLLILLAVTLLAGRYTGYRVSELWRFRSFTQDAGAAQDEGAPRPPS